MSDSVQPDFETHYVNQAQLHFGVYDFTIDFGRIEDPRQPGPQLAPITRIQMSPQHAKVLTLMLLKHIAAYEHQMGIIELPAALLQELHLASLQHFVSQVNLNE